MFGSRSVSQYSLKGFEGVMQKLCFLDRSVLRQQDANDVSDVIWFDIRKKSKARTPRPVHENLLEVPRDVVDLYGCPEGFPPVICCVGRRGTRVLLIEKIAQYHQTGGFILLQFYSLADRSNYF